jgi:hypothetical protein
MQQQPDFLQFIFQAINNLLTQNLGFFDANGPKPLPLLRHNFSCLVRSEIRSCRCWRETSLPIRQFCQPSF